MRVTVDSIVSEKPHGIIFAATVADGGSRRGQHLRVRAEHRHLLGLPAVGDTWEIDGELVQTSYGPQIAARGGRRLLSSGRLVRDFLASHVPGIGTERAERLWAAFGENLPEMLSTDDMLEEIAVIVSPDKPVLGKRLAVLVCAAWRAASSEAALVAWLDRLGVRDVGIVRRLHRVLGDKTMETIAASLHNRLNILKKVQSQGKVRLLDGPDRQIMSIGEGLVLTNAELDSIRDFLDPRMMKAKQLKRSDNDGISTVHGHAIADPGFTSALRKILQSYALPE